MTRREALVAAGAAMWVAPRAVDGDENSTGIGPDERPPAGTKALQRLESAEAQVAAEFRAGSPMFPDGPSGFGVRLMKALGLEGRLVKSLDLHVAVKEVVTVNTVEFVQEEHGDGLVEVMKAYRLKECHDDTT